MNSSEPAPDTVTGSSNKNDVSEGSGRARVANGHEAKDRNEADESPKARRNDSQSNTSTITYSPESALRHPKSLLYGMIEGLWSSRGLSWRLLLRNIRGMYRQTLLGLFWAFLPPIAQTAIWVFLQQNSVVRVDTPVAYVAYVLTGMILWQGFIDAFQAPLSSVASGKRLLSKINFPRESLLVVSQGEVLFNLAIRSLLLVVVLVLFLDEFHWTALLAPVGMLSLVLLGTGLGLLIVPIGTLYQDVSRFVTLAAPFWMLLTPIVYLAPSSGWGRAVVWANPVSPLLMATRDLTLLGQTEYLLPAALIAVFSIPLLIAGLIIYRLSMPILIERMNA